MWLLSTYVFIIIIIPSVMFLASIIISSKNLNMEVFECGFDSFNVSVFPVSLRFFVFCIIFLVLDLELILMSLTPFVLWSSGFILNIVFFLIFVTISMLMEWMFGSLSWVE